MHFLGDILHILGGFGEHFAFWWGHFCPEPRQNKDFLLEYTPMYVVLYYVHIIVNIHNSYSCCSCMYLLLWPHEQISLIYSVSISLDSSGNIQQIEAYIFKTRGYSRSSITMNIIASKNIKKSQ